MGGGEQRTLVQSTMFASGRGIPVEKLESVLRALPSRSYVKGSWNGDALLVYDGYSRAKVASIDLTTGHLSWSGPEP